MRCEGCVKEEEGGKGKQRDVERESMECEVLCEGYVREEEGGVGKQRDVERALRSGRCCVRGA